MTLLYAILCYGMSAFNLYRSFSSSGTMNAVFAVIWLALGIFETIQYIKTKNRK